MILCVQAHIWSGISHMQQMCGTNTRATFCTVCPGMCPQHVTCLGLNCEKLLLVALSNSLQHVWCCVQASLWWARSLRHASARRCCRV